MLVLGSVVKLDGLKPPTPPPTSIGPTQGVKLNRSQEAALRLVLERLKSWVGGSYCQIFF